jgi:sporulation protein YlmC with PRC-barrel domain
MHRAISSLIGYKMAAMDGKIGKVEDFYFDDQVWIIVYLIVKTGNWLSGRKVLISPVALIKGADRDGTFPVTLTREQIVGGPEIDTDKPLLTKATQFGKEEAGPHGDPHLRSTHATIDYYIETPDGELGYLRDLIIDDETWHIKSLIIEMPDCLEGKTAILPLNHVKEVRWSMSKILVDITSNQFKDIPEFRKSDYSYSEAEDTGR